MLTDFKIASAEKTENPFKNTLLYHYEKMRFFGGLIREPFSWENIKNGISRKSGDHFRLTLGEMQAILFGTERPSQNGLVRGLRLVRHDDDDDDHNLYGRGPGTRSDVVLCRLGWAASRGGPQRPINFFLENRPEKTVSRNC